jgi:Domain of unknown function (DUF927)
MNSSNNLFSRVEARLGGIGLAKSFACHQDDLLMYLRSRGVSALYENKREILDYLDKEHKKFGAKQPEHFWESVNVVDWHSSACFVLPNQVIGNQSEVWFQGAGEGAQYSQKGTLDDWKRVAALCVRNPYLIFALSCGFTGPLLSPLNTPERIRRRLLVAEHQRLRPLVAFSSSASLIWFTFLKPRDPAGPCAGIFASVRHFYS